MNAKRTNNDSGKVEQLDEKKAKTLFQLIQGMTVPEKINLAVKGDKEARTLLILDSNKMVQLAVIENPRVTESEVVNISRSRNVNEEVLRKIANNKEWSKLYQVRLALVNNPKTPVAVALRLVQTLRLSDLKTLASSKSVPSVVSSTARRMVMKKKMV